MTRLLATTVVICALAQGSSAQAPVVQAPAAQAPATQVATQVVGSMSELMIKIIYPTSDAIFYISTRTPKNDVEWDELTAKALTLAESGNLLLLPGRARDQDRWVADTKLLIDAGNAAFKAAKKKDLAALAALNDALYASCVTCHADYRTTYRRRLPAPAPTTTPPPAPPQ